MADRILQYRSAARRRKQYWSGTIVVLVILSPAIVYYVFWLGRTVRAWLQ